MLIHRMAYFLFNFTKSGAKKDQSLRDQAAALMKVRLWGIGDKTPNKENLAPGDRVLIYVGAPEQQFIGHATISKPVHRWDPTEVGVYPEGAWPSGVALAEATVWPEPIPLKKVWPRMPSSATNPEARFFAGVVRIKQKDFEVVLAEAGEAAATAEQPAAPKSQALVAPASDAMIDRPFAVAEKLKQFLATGQQIGEDATRAMFINHLIEALGYTEFGDVEYGVQVESKDFADYVLTISLTTFSPLAVSAPWSLRRKSSAVSSVLSRLLRSSSMRRSSGFVGACSQTEGTSSSMTAYPMFLR